MPADAAGTAGDVVLASLADYSTRLTALTPAVVTDEPDAVHQARVLVRRLRSVLAASRRLFGCAEVARVRAELGGLGDELGRVRDLEVRIAQADEYLGVPAAEAMRRRFVDELRARHRMAHESFVARLESGVAMSAPIEAFLEAALEATPDTAPSSAGLVGPNVLDEQLLAMLTAELCRVLRAEARAENDLASLHRLRRAARRLRYVADAVADAVDPELGSRLRALSASAETVQDLLGANRDGRLFAEELEVLADDGDDDAPSTAGNRAVVATIEAEAAAHLGELPGAMAELRRRASAVTGALGDAD